MSLAIRILKRSKTALSETGTLVSALVKEPATSTTKARDVLICHARNKHNSVATSFLRVDREVGLIRYHGIQGYVALWAQGNPGGLLGMVYDGKWNRGTNPWVRMKKLMYGTRGEDHDERDDLDSGDGNQDAPILSKRRATVAFMITASQRMELTTRLGYVTEEIKKLKPLEALLILEHDIKPGNGDIVLRLVRENEELQRAEAEEVLMEQSTFDEKAQLKSDAYTTENEIVQKSRLARGSTQSSLDDAGVFSTEKEHDYTSETTRQNDRLLEISGGFDSPPPLELGDSENSGKESETDVWFEVVEFHDESGKSNVVALYKTEEEAQDCIDWKIDATRRHHEEKDSTRPMPRFEFRQR
mmetsp:Transcript_24838/g.72758  ORF Transcript_24838/g.72758 Transcript_24838/m.72758 type:complete len:358 (-) Transcript_24838:392-1465(-)